MMGTTHSAREHRRLAAGVHGEAAADQGRGDKAADDAADVRGEVDDDERGAELGQGDAVSLVQKFGQPEEEEPSDRIGEELARGEGPRLAVAQKVGPGDWGGALDGVAADKLQLGAGDAGDPRACGRSRARRRARRSPLRP